MTIHRYDGESGQTKLERISALSAKDKGIVFNNIGHIINIAMLKEIYYDLNGKKAIGVDGVTKERYGEDLDKNLEALLVKIRRGQYRPKPARLVEIPKEDGSTRPLAISCLEDKLVQSAVNKILVSIYEPMFYSTSYGFRPGKNCHQALKSLMSHTYRFYDGAVVEIDLQKCFNTLPHGKVLECLQKKISDKRFLKLVSQPMKTPMITEFNQVAPNEIGCPQGSIISPTISNIYLHDVIDDWFEKIKQGHLTGKAEMVRYCDDMVFLFQKQTDAERFYRVLPKRLNKFGLLLHMEKSQLLRSGQIAAKEAAANKSRLPTYKFLGFTCYWGTTRNGFWRLKYTSRRDRFSAKLKSLRKYLRENLNTSDTWGLLEKIVRVVKGWLHYHGISDNKRRVSAFLNYVKHIMFAWVNRRGRKNPINWTTFEKII
ncbi:group II intron reverse transcriptase/maturase [Legionella israelensis]|uniref:Reverse transcriptase (RNA-directed DNA polymerase) n=1 Tax=Legionella israelensis TaxID=454 RepID=A0A0W0VJV8_9GAMM|nr:group II intron reverse transcriptase/maturase [Legionella israelensis]KTD20221.1 reverse transcriptase (RNA-directed DNA polymerase) [Legionella israelensis]QBS09008.1 group II intron reverse transcriptase/maturase [Legionella israelensis]SCY39605.1 group II intron reverse transcriptase/maturase [Legionella israelensis DSM 19235]STX58713.1 reverse transcriptase (RNA-directed DNA polymerase) [Legionella israelensis]